jgi:hypothetical protein
MERFLCVVIAIYTASKQHDNLRYTMKPIKIFYYFGNQCIRAANFIDYGSQVDWAALIKAQAIKTATYNAPVVNSTNIEASNWQTQVALTHFLVKENDGLLSKEAQLLTGAQRIYKANGANHMLQGNHKSVREALESIFNTSSEFSILRR